MDAMIPPDDAEAQHRAELLELANRNATAILAGLTGAEALRDFAGFAAELVGARYCAVGVASFGGDSLDEFVTYGMTPATEEKIGTRPHGIGVLGILLNRTTPLRLDTLSDHPASVGFPANHPPMQSFLGIPIRHNETLLGSIYLTEKDGGFTETDEVTIQAISMHLAVAIRNLQLLKRQRTLVAGLIAAQEEERRAVAYDLHDGLTQYVMAAQMHLSAFRRAVDAGQIVIDSPALREMFDLGMSYLRDSVVESRRLINGLRSLALDDMGLVGALEQLVQEEKARASWSEANYSHNVGGERFGTALETAIYRVAQEALTNARKHAAATTIEVWLLRESRGGVDWLTLDVRDDGKGFVPEAFPASAAHIGLHGIAERVRLLQGEWKIESAPGAGSVLRVQVPIFVSAEGEMHGT